MRPSEMSHKFLPFSRYVYINSVNKMMIAGGLDDTQPNLNLSFFTDYACLLSTFSFNENDEIMQSESVAAMDQGRGCFAMCENE